MKTSALPLSRFRVLDLTRARSGPTVARQFADWGADVIMIEFPQGANELTGGRYSSDFQNLHRNKRSIMLDFKRPECKEVFFDLVRSADALIENFRPGVKHRLGIDYETVHKVNPRLVYGSISGFGQDGPNADRPGVDQIVQGYGGLMSITGVPGNGPVRAGAAISDMASGLYCTIGVLTALLEREVTGVGRWVRTSLLEAQIGMLDFQATRWLIDRTCPVQEGNQHPAGVPMGTFETADGHINLAAAGDEMFRRFCELVDRDDLLRDARFKSLQSRYEYRDALRAEVGLIMKTRKSADWIVACNRAGLPCGPIYSIDEMFEDPQVKHLEITRKVRSPKLGDIELLGQPISFSECKFEVRTPAPELGAHTKEVFAELGYSQARIDALWHSLSGEAREGNQVG